MLRARALEQALRKVGDWVDTQGRGIFPQSPDYDKGWRVGAMQALEEVRAGIRNLLAVPPPPPAGTPTEKVAREIAKHLMMNTLGERCDRLAQLYQGFPIGGGWSLDGAAEQIVEVLENEGYIMDRVAEAQRRATPVAPPSGASPQAETCRVCGGYGFVAQKQTIDDGWGEVDTCPACTDQPAPVSPVEPTPEPPQDGGNPK